MSSLQAHSPGPLALAASGGGIRAPYNNRSLLIWGGQQEAMGGSDGRRKRGTYQGTLHSHFPHSSITGQECKGNRRPSLSAPRAVWSSLVPVGCPSRRALNQCAPRFSGCGRHRAWSLANTAAQKSVLQHIFLPDSQTASPKMHPLWPARVGLGIWPGSCQEAATQGPACRQTGLGLKSDSAYLRALPQFHHLLNGNINQTHVLRQPRGLNEAMEVTTPNRVWGIFSLSFNTHSQALKCV